MKAVPLGATSLEVSRLAYGCMRIAGTWNPAEIGPSQREKARGAVLAAFEAGYTLFDHADIYARGGSETLFGEILRDTPSMRMANLRIATKCGIRFADDPPGAPHRYDFSREHIVWSCEQSLKRLGVDRVDVYQLHRPDLLMNPPEIADAFSDLKRSGKVLHFGVSNFPPSTVAALQAHLGEKLVVNQVEIHLARLACLYDGSLDQCIERGMTPLAWRPMDGGWLGTGGHVPHDHPRREHMLRIQRAVDEAAAAGGFTRSAIALAWLMRHPSRIVPIVGSTEPARIRDAAGADAIELGRDDWYRILVAARGEPQP